MVNIIHKCVVCGSRCNHIIPNIKNFCCWHVPTEDMKMKREDFMCEPCDHMLTRWRVGARYGDQHIWDFYPTTEEPEELKNA